MAGGKPILHSPSKNTLHSIFKFQGSIPIGGLRLARVLWMTQIVRGGIKIETALKTPSLFRRAFPTPSGLTTAL
ncbi:MAG: hypothetical protein FD139_2549 [Methylocystaceae bacterium]|nr:MAG: hypothetical protein FD148_424 [Methylocystaceae bacterium]KAF0207995.1 MAG: hypothetical protein FD172_3573 [Methylocystaceae bacterium]TXT44083.1 MAG: hypothetical protein FD139_2549 [Methylocystaceae bacterium]